MEGEKSFKERRKYVRLEASVEVKYKVIGKPGEIKAFSRDISAGGLCIFTEEALDADTPLEVQIKIPDLKDPIHALGRTIWQKEFKDEGGKQDVFRTGLEFTGISDFDRFNINRYVMERVEPEA